MNRRQFNGALFAAAVGDREGVCRVLDARGEPLSLVDRPPFWYNFHLCDFKLRPFPMQPKIAAGEVRFPVPNRPFRIAVNLPVPGFGHVFAYADNRGAGHTAATVMREKPLLLNLEFAADRLAAVRALAGECRQASIVVPAATATRIDRAAAVLAKAQAAKEEREAAGVSLESLAESLWAGEELVFERAKQLIGKHGPRPGFLFNCTPYWCREKGKAYVERFEELFNVASLPFYPSQYEAQPGKYDYSWPDGILESVKDRPVVCLGHPLYWFARDFMPPHFRGLPFDEMMRRASEAARHTVLRYKHRIHMWVVVNEGHLWNPGDFEAGQMIEATKIALRVTRDADPTAYRIINCAMMWNEAICRAQPRGVQTIYDYLKALAESGAEYDAVGLEFYYTSRDMLETERVLDLYKEFGHPLYITESEVPGTSDPARPANAPPWFMPAPPSWHGTAWTETVQADWAEQFYTLAYSKPWVEMAGWWSLSDFRSSFAQGGFLREDNTPKEIFHRLLALRQRWAEKA